MLQSITPYIFQNLVWIPTRIVLLIFTRFKVRGLENLRGLNRGVIFASNHQSELDPILIPASLPFLSHLSPIFYVSREKSFYDPTILKQIFYGGFFFELWGAYQTHPGLHNYEASLKDHITILETGHSLSIFPEGGKSEDGTMKEAKGGMTFLSHRTNTPIVPVFISGDFNVNFLDFLRRRYTFTVTFGKPIHPKELFFDEVKDPHMYKVVAQDVMAKIRAISQ